MKLTNVLKRIYRSCKFILFRIKYMFIKPSYPVNQDNKTYIHLGCGDVVIPGYINVDSRAMPHIHHLHDVRKLPFLKNETADLVYASHILEHVPVRDLPNVINEWNRVLKPGGILRIGVPDFDTILEIYKDNENSIDMIWMPLMGGQEYPQNFHYSVYNKEYLTKLLKDCGFSEVRTWNHPADQKIKDWTTFDFRVNDKSYNLSLNIEAVK